MGEEHAYLQHLSGIVRRDKGPLLDMPSSGFGSGTPNKKALRCAIWALQQPADGMSRLRELYRATTGHFAIGAADPEPLTPTHSQLWYAAYAGHLLAAVRVGDKALREKVEAVWQVETAACAACTSALGVRTPGARAYIDGKPALVNSLRDKVSRGLAQGWKKEPRVGKEGDYDVAIPLLGLAFKEGAKPSALVGTDYSALTQQYGFHVNRDGDGYFAWFDRDFGGLETIYGVGVTNGEILLREDVESAVHAAERFAQ